MGVFGFIHAESILSVWVCQGREVGIIKAPQVVLFLLDLPHDLLLDGVSGEEEALNTRCLGSVPMRSPHDLNQINGRVVGRTDKGASWVSSVNVVEVNTDTSCRCHTENSAGLVGLKAIDVALPVVGLLCAALRVRAIDQGGVGELLAQVVKAMAEIEENAD